jgi:parvulin-like peptidyl-prolyl isomerase
MVRAIQTIWGFVVPATVVALLALGGGSAMGSAALPAPDELPATMVAVVSEVPVGRGRITKGEFQHALLLEAVSAGRRSAPKPGGAGYEKSKVIAVGSLLERVWVYGEAAEMNIAVTHREVAREVALIKRESFKDGAEFRRFLKEARYTRRDVNEQVEIQMLGTRLQRRFFRQIGRETSSKSEEQQAFTEFAAEFSKKWRSRTVCAADYVTDRCSNAPAA